MSEERFIELETRLAWQEAALKDLSDVAAAQQRRIAELEKLCRALGERLTRAQPGIARGSAEDEVPPHW